MFVAGVLVSFVGISVVTNAKVTTYPIKMQSAKIVGNEVLQPYCILIYATSTENIR